MLSNVDQEKLQHTKLISMSGARVQTLKSNLQKPEYYGIRADLTMLMTGTVNLMDAKDKPEYCTYLLSCNSF